MPDNTIVAFEDHGQVTRTIDIHLDEAKQVMNDLRGLEINYDAVTHQLEVEGVQKFTESFTELIAGVQGKVMQVG